MLYGVVGWHAEVMMTQTSLLVDVPVLTHAHLLQYKICEQINQKVVSSWSAACLGND
jgi:hypothetical protein